MATTISIRFPSGRYHATPWERSANEAAVEWPPSPWRVLRALYSAWKNRLPHVDQEIAHAILASLVDPPSFVLPPYTESHVRHYMPDVHYIPNVAGGRDKVLDGFVVVDPHAPVIIQWPVDLEASQRDVLAQLCSTVSYLGRAESICDMELTDDTDHEDAQEWSAPGVPIEPSQIPARVLVPKSPLDISALVARAGKVRKGGRVTPPGARWISYPTVLPVDRIPPRPKKIQPPVHTAVLLRFDAPALPSHFEAVAYGEVLRSAAMSMASRQRPIGGGSGGDEAYGDGMKSAAASKDRDESAARFSGKDRNGDERLDGHLHAHFLTLDLDKDRQIDSALVWAKEGLDARQIGALFSIRKLDSQRFRKRYRTFRAVRVVAEAIGEPEDLVPELCRGSREWTSVTPFAPYRHQKKHQEINDFLKIEINRELLSRGLDVLAERVLVVEQQPWLSFRRNRLGEEPYRALGVRIELDRNVKGPLVLGALSHFGLGLFRPV